MIIAIDDIEKHLDITIETDTNPTDAQFNEWIEVAQENIFDATKTNFELGDYTTPVIKVRTEEDTLFANTVKLNSITKIDIRDDSAFENDFVEFTTGYKIDDSDLASIRFQNILKKHSVRITYNGGYSEVDMPKKIKRLACLYVELLYNQHNLAIYNSDPEGLSLEGLSLSDRTPVTMEYRSQVVKQEIDEILNDLPNYTELYAFAEDTGEL